MGFIGKYETFEIIGNGSMATVYLAKDPLLDREVALKVLHTNLDAELRERFYREARAGLSLQHPNIARVWDLNESNNVTYIAMELLKGEDLKRYIEKKRAVPLAQKIEFMAQVCDGLGEAHRKGIVHRDIKPSNIFIHEERTAKLLDFGIARLPTSKLTMAGKVLGTPNYMAPEQILDRKSDARSDLFSVAVVFYEFLVHAHPFQSSCIPKRIAYDEPDSLRERDPLIPDSLVAVLRMALRKEPEGRFTTAEDLAAQLRGVLQNLRVGMATFENLEPNRANDGSDAHQNEPDVDDEFDSGSVSEFVRLLKECDAALKIRDLGGSQRLLAKMQSLAGVNEHFAGAAQEYAAKLKELAGDKPARGETAAAGGSGAAFSRGGLKDEPNATPSSSPVKGAAPMPEGWDDTYPQRRENSKVGRKPSIETPNTAPVPRSPEVVCRFCGASNRDTAKYCRDCGRDLNLTKAGAWLQDARGYLTSFWSALKKFHAGMRTPRSDSGRRSSQLIGRPAVLIGILAASLTLLVFVIVAVKSLTRPVVAERAVGTAVVQVAAANLRQNQNGTGKILMALRQGTRVNLLERLPGPRSSFIRVQFVSPRGNSHPGYLSTRDLTQWASDDPSVAWDFIVLIRPAGDADETRQREFTNMLEGYATRFDGRPLAEQAQIEEIKILISLVKQARQSGKSPSEEQGDLDRANTLAAEQVSPANAPVLEDLRAQLAALKPPPEDASPPPPRPDSETIARQQRMRQLDELNRRAEKLFQGGDLDGAAAAVDQVFAKDSFNKQALALKSQIDDIRKSLQ